MTRTTNARAAGVTFLVYIGAGLTGMALMGRATSGEGMASKLASLAQHGTDLRVYILLGLVMAFSALVLGVTLYGVTREEDRDIAMLGLVCRVVEAVIVGLSLDATLALRWLATAADAPQGDGAHAVAAYLLRGEMALTATFFAVGSACFSWLLLRGRMIPAALAWLGVIASLLLVVVLPLQLARLLDGPITSLVWLPMLAFEVTVGVWFIVKGVSPTRATLSP
jgi:hypothetical protein